MSKKSSGILLSSLALAATTAVALPGSATAEPGGSPGASHSPAPQSQEDRGRGPGTARTTGPSDRAEVARAAAAAPAAGDPITMPSSYPYQPELRIYAHEPDDASYSAGLVGHADLAPRLTELMAASDRISVQVVGQSTEGRDLYLVTLTAPESTEDTAQQTAWRRRIKEDPTAAAQDEALAEEYKTPIWISNNIHGNEWEGTDAALRYIGELATSEDPAVARLLEEHRIYFSPSLNPDGRTAGTRATQLGLDGNRDMITNRTPEAQSFIRTAQAVQAVYAADFHGYTNVLQIEPCGPPHGSNYEYDLIIPHNYALALRVEQDVVAAEIPGNTYYDPTTRRAVPTNTGRIKIPYRDTPDGWDDFPPIFTAQYAAYYGAATSTVELPLRRGADGRQTPATAGVNTEVAYETMRSIVGYLDDGTHAREMVANQIETFRRAVAGEPKQALTTEGVEAVQGPDQWKPLWDVVDDQEPVALPRAYVIPVGPGQRSGADARALVEQLLLHDIEVGVLDAATTVGGTTYPAGSYVVDMHQPLRGLANALLDLGDDISAKVPSMYDISAWSYSSLWGATVDKVGDVTDAALGAVTPVGQPPVGSVPRRRGPLSLDVAGLPDLRAVNALLEDGIGVSLLEDGSVVVEQGGYDEARALARELTVDFEPATGRDIAALDDRGTKGLTDLTVGYVGTQDDRLALTDLGFDDLVPVTAAALGAEPSLIDGVDVLWVGSAFNPAPLSAARTAVQEWVDEGGSITGRGAAAFNAAASFGLLSGTAVTGNSNGNGIVDVDTTAGGVLAPYAQDHSFIYPATWFTGLGQDVTVEQSYDAEDPFLAGHWRARSGSGGPESAAGQAAAVSSEADSGARSFVFGTAVFFRTHPKGMISQAGRAILWAGPEGRGARPGR